jgi:solute:Na+ symporter, SSS family
VNLSPIDWTIVVAFMATTLAVGVVVSKRAGRSSADFFVSGRGMPWWLLGISMVATTFSAGTPNLVADIVRQKGVAGNWIWWSFLPTGMMTVFLYAKLWRRSGVMTDLEFYELRYSGTSAALLRGFRAVYLGILFNVMVLASANLAAIKICGAMIGTSPIVTVTVASLVTVIFSALGGLTGVLITDFLLFVVSIGGAIAAAVYLINLPEVGGLTALLSHPEVSAKAAMVPSLADPELLVAAFVVPLAVQWWSVWYPGAEPGGGGYIAQRMLAAKNEGHATGATLLFNVAHYALRPWPWLIVALASIVVFPDLASLQERFPNLAGQVIQDDLAYPAMMTLLPVGLRGLVLASLIAAFMSTLSTHLNWGASYVVNDFYKRFLRTDASEKELVTAGRICTLLTMVLAAVVGLCLSNALQAFRIILQIGAGTGLLFILRWFWWRINAISEITAMVVSFLMAIGFEFFAPTMVGWQKLLIGVGVTTFSWIAATFLTRPSDEKVLIEFCRRVYPGGPGWQPVIERAREQGVASEEMIKRWTVPWEIVCMLLGCVVVYAALLATGSLLYADYILAAILFAVALVGGILLSLCWRKVALNN